MLCAPAKSSGLRMLNLDGYRPDQSEGPTAFDQSEVGVVWFHGNARFLPQSV